MVVVDAGVAGAVKGQWAGNRAEAAVVGWVEGAD